MKAWSEPAESRLREWLAVRVRQEGLQGAEAEELAADLRRHVHEELEGSSHETVGLIALESVLERMGGGEREQEVRPAGTGTGPAAGLDGIQALCGVDIRGGAAGVRVVVRMAGVILAGRCFSTPLPDFWHVLLVATVPAVNAVLLVSGQRGRLSPWWAGAAGFAWLVALAYLVVVFAAVAALGDRTDRLGNGAVVADSGVCLAGDVADRQAVFAGFRAKDLAPQLADRCAGSAGGLRSAGGGRISGRGRSWGSRREKGSRPRPRCGRLRAFHSESAILRACYEGSRGTAMSTDIAGWVMRGWRLPVAMFGRGGGIDQVDSERMRDLVFPGHRQAVQPDEASADGAEGKFSAGQPGELR